jgi:hypothetical protein
MIKAFGDAVLKNSLDKDPDKDKGHKKVEKSDVMVYINTEDVYMNNMMDDIIAVVKPNMEYEAGSINTEVGIEAY